MIKKICPNFTHLPSCTLHKFESLRGNKAGYRLGLICYQEGEGKTRSLFILWLTGTQNAESKCSCSKFSFLLEKQMRWGSRSLNIHLARKKGKSQREGYSILFGIFSKMNVRQLITMSLSECHLIQPRTSKCRKTRFRSWHRAKRTASEMADNISPYVYFLLFRSWVQDYSYRKAFAGDWGKLYSRHRTLKYITYLNCNSGLRVTS